MDILKRGSRGPHVSLLQLALNRSGFGELQKDGIFGVKTENTLKCFQTKAGLISDGICGKLTHQALMPWYTGFVKVKALPGDSFYSLSRRFGTSLQAVLTANPNIPPENIQIGCSIIIPLPFDVVPYDVDYCSELIGFCITGLKARYPFLKVGKIGKSTMGKPLWNIMVGNGRNRVAYNASHHANEWITTPILLKFIEDFSTSYASDGEIYGEKAAEIFNYSTICVIPAVNPDGIDLVTGALTEGNFYMKAKRLALDYPTYPFPSGWKANIAGTDLNLQYPAGWEQAKKNKYAQGIVSPAPADFVGLYPLSAVESRAMYDFTMSFDPSLILAYHTQGNVIYWKYSDYEPFNSRRIAQLFSTISGYSVENTPYSSAFAGYKDWFIKDFNRPGYTIEAGLGKNPLPISDFPEIYEKNLGILTLGAIVT